MKYKLATTCFVIGSVLRTLCGLVRPMETPTVPNPRPSSRTSVITTKIKSKLAAEHPASAKHIKVVIPTRMASSG